MLLENEYRSYLSACGHNGVYDPYTEAEYLDAWKEYIDLMFRVDYDMAEDADRKRIDELVRRLCL